jgi:threonine synthase
MILDVLNDSEGEAVAITDEELIQYSRMIAEHTGIFPAPEGGATLAALTKLKEDEWIMPDEEVVLFNTGTGFKYMDALAKGSSMNKPKADIV